MKDFQHYLIQDIASIKDALIALNSNLTDILTLLVVNHNGQMVGSLTDGDIRRGLISGKELTDNVKDIMLTSFRYISYKNKTVTLIKEYKENGIELLPYLNEEGIIEKVYELKKLSSILPIDAVIMAGGKGERLYPLTLNTPKPLLKIGGKSIIDYNVDRLINYGVEHINITTNYLGEQIENHYKEPINNIHIKCVREPKFLGTIGSIKFIDFFENDTILVMNSDLFTNIDFEHFYLHFIQNDADISVAAVPYTVNIPYGIFELSNSNIKGIKEKPTYNYYANAGIYLIKRKLLELIPNDTFYNATDFMEFVISKKLKVIRFPLTGYWIDIGKPTDYQKAQDFVKHLDL